MKVWLLIIVTLLLTQNSTAFGLATAIPMDQIRDSSSFDKKIYYFESTSKLTASEAYAKFQNWSSTLAETKLQGYDNSEHWFYFQLANSKDEADRIAFFLSNRLISLAEVYTYHNHIPTEQALAQRIKNRTPSFVIEVPPETSIAVLVKINFGLQTLLRISFTRQLENVLVDNPINYALQANYGLFAAMILFNFLFYILTYEKTFFLHSLAAFSIASATFLIDGSAFVMIGSAWINESIAILGNLGVAFTALFVRAYLKIDQRTPWMNLQLTIHAIIGLISAVLLTLGFSKKLIYFTDVNLFVLCSSVFTIGSYYLKKGDRNSKFYLIGWLGLAFGGIAWIGSEYHVIPVNPITANALNFGLGFEMIVISLGLADQINFYKDALIEQNRNLEKTVLMRTADLNARVKDIKSILSNIQQGILKIKADLTIHAEYSDYLSTILGTKKIAGVPFQSLLLDRSKLQPYEKDRIISALSLSFNEHYINFQANCKTLPGELLIEEESTVKVLELEWVPMLEEDHVHAIMLTIRDVTELRHLRNAARQQENELLKVEEMVQAERGKLQIFLQDTHAACLVYKQNFEAQSEAFSQSQLDDFYRFLHTLKGNARSIGLNLFASQIHHSESEFEKLLKSSQQIGTGQLLDILSIIKEELLSYQRILIDKIHGGVQLVSENRNIFEQWYAELKESMSKVCLKHGLTEHDKQVHLDMLASSYELMQAVSMAQIFKILEEEITIFCQQLDKEPVHFQAVGPRPILKKQAADKLLNALRHCLRNCIDHGIEDRNTRIALGKPVQGLIKITVDQTQDQTSLLIEDDGQGINLEKLREKALEKKLIEADQFLSPIQTAELMFQSQISTARTLTEISGRGIGMDVARNNIEALNGRVNLLEKTSSSLLTAHPKRLPFLLLIELPASCFISMSDAKLEQSA